MGLKHRILAASYPLLKAKSFITRRLHPMNSGRLRVMLYHDIAPENEESFAGQLRWLSQSWSFITPEQFIAMLTGTEPLIKDCLMLSFDDGFSSNRRVAESILNPMGIHALFFVVSEFVDLNENDDWKGFVSKFIYPSIKTDEVPTHSQNMNWSDLNFLLETGHTIGAHTGTHARLTELPIDTLNAEIIESANTLERKLGIDITHFAYTFGNLASFSHEALAVALSRFSYIYTGLRGNNASGIPKWAIRRDAIQARDTLNLVGALLEGGADHLYKRHLAEYESWGKY
jgi:peptidoglycan/xylan/chitin deacetylase (PgdA/CDA1 family)